MSRVVFDGVLKHITVNNDVTNINVGRDLYSEWKRWIINDHLNAKYLRAFYVIGGNPVGGGRYSPSYFFLDNDWKVIVDGIVVAFATNLYTYNQTSPFIVSNNGGVSNETSDAQAVKNEVDRVLDFQGQVYVDENLTSSGTEYPYGTLAKPVNNLDDAVLIAEIYNIKDIQIMSHLTLTQSIAEYSIHGKINTEVDLNGQDCTGAYFDRCKITGKQVGVGAIYYECSIDELVDFTGLMKECIFISTIPIVIQANSNSVLDSCRSAIAGTNSPSFDFINGGISFSNRAYSGGMRYLNSTDINNVVTTEYIAGKIKFCDCNTAGTFVFRGIVDDSELEYDTGATIVDGGMISSKTFATKNDVIMASQL